MKTKILLFTFLMFTSTWTMSAQDISSGLVTYFNMEHSLDGTTEIDPINSKPLQDLSGLNKNGINVGTTKGYAYTTVANANGFSYSKVMTSQYAVAGHLITQPAIFNRGKGDYSIAFWINMNYVTPPVPGHNDFQFLAYNNTNVTSVGFPGTKTLACLINGKFSALSTNPDDFVSAPDTIHWGTWYHYTVVSEYTNRKTKLYVNGALVAEKIIAEEDVVAVTAAAGGVLLRRGGGGNVYYYDGIAEGLDSIPANATFTIPTQNLIFAGKMDEFRLYNRALTSEEVGLVMNVNDVSTDIRKTQIDRMKIYGLDGNNIIVDSDMPTSISIYNSVGVLMLRKDVEAGSQVIDIANKGYYFVNANGKVYKVVVR